MQVKCKYCGADISNTDERCKNCGAVNDQLVRTANGAPKTIEELKNWYIEHNLPDEKTTRFFIGKNIKEARAFGIYKDEQTGNFVVYKNKDTGIRAVRYEGNDEAYAVNELYQRLKQEIQNQKRLKRNKDKKHSRGYNFLKVFVIISIIMSTITIISSAVLATKSHEGYYYYEDNVYYYYNENWYKVTNEAFNEWEYLGKTKPIDKTFISKYYHAYNTTKDEIPESVYFYTSGYYFKSCGEGYYTTDEETFFYFYNDKWYVYKSLIESNGLPIIQGYESEIEEYNEQLQKLSENKMWQEIDIEDYKNNLNQDIAKGCYTYRIKDYNESWGIKDFRNSSYFIPDEGYYNYNGTHYYYWRNHGWYYYNNGSWEYTTMPIDYFDYYEDRYYDSDSEYDNFSNSSYYQDYLEEERENSKYDDDDWDSDSDWDSGDSWDSGGTDWSSDW